MSGQCESHDNNGKPTQAAPSAEASPEMVADAVEYLLRLTCDCQVRGGYQLEDAVALNQAKEHIESSAPAQDAHVHLLKRLVLLAQRSGALALQEAWAAFNAIQILENKK